MIGDKTVGKRVLLVASAGGHWVQLTRLSAAFEGCDSLYATTMQGAEAPTGLRPVKVVVDGSKSSLFRLPLLVAQLLGILVRFRPHVIITTGAAPGLLALQLGKLLGCRTVWIDSLANSEELSLSGRMARPFADLWLTQWPHLVEAYPGLECHGGVL
jgi:hypothetical protein